MAQYFNKYFTSIATDLLCNSNQAIPLNLNDPSNFRERINYVNNSFFLFPTNVVEIFNIIASLPNKGNALYVIKPRLLNLVLDQILPVLKYLFNFCIESGTYPNILKIARVIPIYKSGTLSKACNYRPISNLNNFNKIF